MAKKQREEESGGSWMDTYGDMVTLLLTFFVMLYSMSSITDEKWQEIVSAFNIVGEEKVDAREKELNEKEKELKEKEEELNEREEELNEREAELDDREEDVDAREEEITEREEKVIRRTY